jgi:hypothetical protein
MAMGRGGPVRAVLPPGCGWSLVPLPVRGHALAGGARHLWRGHVLPSRRCLGPHAAAPPLGARRPTSRTAHAPARPIQCRHGRARRRRAPDPAPARPPARRAPRSLALGRWGSGRLCHPCVGTGRWVLLLQPALGARARAGRVHRTTSRRGPSSCDRDIWRRLARTGPGDRSCISRVQCASSIHPSIHQSLTLWRRGRTAGIGSCKSLGACQPARLRRHTLGLHE